MYTIKDFVNKKFIHFQVYNSGVKWFCKKWFLDRAYRALGAVLYIVHRKLDLSLLSDQRVLKERDTAQEDRVTGALNTERDRERDEIIFKSPTEGRKQGQASSGVPL